MSKRCKTPSVFQMEIVECGAAALCMILGYYKRFVTLEQLRLDCGVSRDGSKASNIVRAAKLYGLDAEGYKIDSKDLDEIRMPCIVFWQLNHFIVVEGITKDKVYINDPGSGHAVLTWEEFNNGYSDIVLEFTPNEHFEAKGRDPSITLKLLKRLVPYMPQISFLFLYGMLFTLLGLATPLFGKIFVDNFLIEHTQSTIKLLVLGVTITLLLRTMLSFLQNHYLIKLENKLSISFSKDFLLHLLQLPMRFFTMRNAGDITLRMELNRNVAKFIGGVFIETVLQVCLVLLYLGLMLYLNFTISIAILLIAIINGWIFYRISVSRKEKSMLLSADLGKYYSRNFSAFRIMETLKASGAEQEIFAKVIGAQTKVSNVLHKLIEKSTFIGAVPLVLTLFSSIVVIFLGSLKIMDGEMTVGTLVALQIITVSFLNPLNNLIIIAGTIIEMGGMVSKLDDVLEYKVEENVNLMHFSEKEHILNQEKSKLSGLIEIKNLSFGYNVLEKPLLSKINITIHPGEHVALVGASGCGKSTLAKLIAGLYIPWDGKIEYDNIPLITINKMILANSIAMVEQDNILFNCSIRDNITLWDSTILDKDIIQSAKDAYIHDQISLKPHGYDTQVKSNASNFSGGERQRIDIARALVNKPNVLILDEATSELDPIIENEIYNNIRRTGCTTIIVAHRLNTVRHADRIIVLDKGKISQVGTHDELISIDGHYKNLMSMI